MPRNDTLLAGGIAVVVGIINGYYVFNPAFQEQRRQKREKSEKMTELPAEASIRQRPDAFVQKDALPSAYTEPAAAQSSWSQLAQSLQPGDLRQSQNKNTDPNMRN